MMPLQAMDAGARPLAVPQSRPPALAGADEMFRGIYTRAGLGTPEIVLVSSAIAGEGKTTVALGLATALAEDFPQLRVLLVEADLQQPVLANDFGVELSPGLAEMVLDGVPPVDACRPTLVDNLQILPAGGPVDNAARLLRSSRTVGLLESLRETHDVIIIDAPAVLVRSDTLVLADLADSVLFVVRAGVTPLQQVNQALDQIEEKKLRGVVLNGQTSAIPRWLRRLCGL